VSLGRVFRRKYRGKDGKLRKCKVWTLEYYVPGEPEKRREPSGTTDQKAALDLLRQRQEQIGKAIPVGPAPDTVTFGDLALLITSDYTAKGNRSGRRLLQLLGHLNESFGRFRAVAITGERILSHIAKRKGDGAMPASINRELAVLRRMFRLGVKHRLLLHDHVPFVELLPEHNIRHGLITPFQMGELLAEIDDPIVCDAAEMTYITGWRADSDVLTRQWPHVQFHRGVLILETWQGKARKARKFPLFPRLKEIMERRWKYTEWAREQIGQDIPWVFHRMGKPIHYYRRRWLSACLRLSRRYPDWGAETWIRHRMRYSAVENLLAAHVPIPDILKMVGMTMATFLRYHQQSEAGILRAGVRLDDFFKGAGTPPGDVVPFKMTGPR
jgi:integrase